jgi:hypothetical protein
MQVAEQKCTLDKIRASGGFWVVPAVAPARWCPPPTAYIQLRRSTRQATDTLHHQNCDTSSRPGRMSITADFCYQNTATAAVASLPQTASSSATRRPPRTRIACTNCHLAKVGSSVLLEASSSAQATRRMHPATVSRLTAVIGQM